jgi:origin recognition complex subunit 1
MHAAADAYTQFWRAINGEIVSSNTAKLRIEEYLNHKTDNRQPLPIVCLLDELDFLITKNENIVYNFFNWSMSCNFLLLIGVSNVSDLPERLTTR